MNNCKEERIQKLLTLALDPVCSQPEFENAGIALIVYLRKHKLNYKDFKNVLFGNSNNKEVRLFSNNPTWEDIIKEYRKYPTDFSSEKQKKWNETHKESKSETYTKYKSWEGHTPDKFPFGKYNGQEIGMIVKSDKQYCEWCLRMPFVVDDHPSFRSRLEQEMLSVYGPDEKY